MKRPDLKAGEGNAAIAKANASKERVLAALRETVGNVTEACESADVSRTQFYKWQKDDPDFADKVSELGESVKDWVESKLHNNINLGDTTAMIFWLKCRAKDRGYVERTELTGRDGAPLSPIFVAGVSYEQRITVLLAKSGAADLIAKQLALPAASE